MAFSLQVFHIPHQCQDIAKFKLLAKNTLDTHGHRKFHVLSWDIFSFDCNTYVCVVMLLWASSYAC